MAPPSPEDMEAARLLREMVRAPRQGALWAQYHGGWSGNTLDAFERGAGALRAQMAWVQVADLARLARDPGTAVAIVLETGLWPANADRAMVEAAAALDPQGSAG